MLAPIMTRLTGPFIAGRTWLFISASQQAAYDEWVAQEVAH
jgi:hypothetical protein